MLLKIAKHIILLICLISAFSCKFLDSETIPLTENCQDYYKVLQDSIKVDGKRIYMYRIDSTDCNLFIRYDKKKIKLTALKQFLSRNQYLLTDSASVDSVLMDTVISEIEVVEEVKETAPPTPEPIEEPKLDSIAKQKLHTDSLQQDSSLRDSSKKKKKDGFLGLF